MYVCMYVCTDLKYLEKNLSWQMSSTPPLRLPRRNEGFTDSSFFTRATYDRAVPHHAKR